MSGSQLKKSVKKISRVFKNNTKLSTFQLKIIHKSKNLDGLKLNERKQSIDAKFKITEILEFGSCDKNVSAGTYKPAWNK